MPCWPNGARGAGYNDPSRMTAIRPHAAPVARIIAFPRAGISYTECLYEAAEALGAEVLEGIWSSRWLAANVHRGDVVHLHWPSFFYYDPESRGRTLLGLVRFVGLLALVRLLGARIAWTAHNLYPHDGGRREWTHRVARSALVSASEAVFVHGAAAGELVARELGVAEGKLIRIPHGHWMDRYPRRMSRDEARRSLGIPGDAFVYGFVGLCKPYKGLASLVEAFAEQADGAFLLLAGRFQSREYRELVSARIARLPARSVLFRPEVVPDEEIQRYLLATDALVLPYEEILTSGTAILGLSFGVPVVVPRLGGLPDLVDERCGVLYEPRDVAALSHAMQRVRGADLSHDGVLARAKSLD